MTAHSGCVTTTWTIATATWATPLAAAPRRTSRCQQFLKSISTKPNHPAQGRPAKGYILHTSGPKFSRDPARGMTIAESLSHITNGCGGTINDQGTWTTGSQGQMLNPPADGIHHCCTSGQNCTTTFDQTFTGHGYPVIIVSQDGNTTGNRNHITRSCANGVGSCPIVSISP
jgi:hypothetical protein